MKQKIDTIERSKDREEQKRNKAENAKKKRAAIEKIKPHATE